VRTDFVTRPPRVTPEALAALWGSAEKTHEAIPFVDAVTLAELKKTNREKLPLREAHRIIVSRAEGVLPFELEAPTS
jgi:hypothetical protein